MRLKRLLAGALLLAVTLTGCQTNAKVYEVPEAGHVFTDEELLDMFGGQFQMTKDADTFTEMLAQCPVVLSGTVSAKTPVGGKQPFTYVEIQVDAVYKGEAEDVIYTGGLGFPVPQEQVEDLTARYPDEPLDKLNCSPMTYVPEGTRILLFTKRNASKDSPTGAVYPVWGLYQGVYGLAEDGALSSLVQKNQRDNLTVFVAEDLLTNYGTLEKVQVLIAQQADS